jgi:hypothetical protein
MNLKPIRVGYPASVRPSLQPYTLQAKMTGHALYGNWEELRTENDKLIAEMSQLATQILGLESELRRTHSVRKELRLAKMRIAAEGKKKHQKNLRIKIYQLEQIIYTDLCKEADVVRRLQLLRPLHGLLKLVRFAQHVSPLSPLRSVESTSQLSSWMKLQWPRNPCR